jgi:hypothetical protein
MNKDSLHVVPVLNINGDIVFELLLYGLDKHDVYTIPNAFVAQALNHRELPPDLTVSPFLVRRER